MAVREYSYNAQGKGACCSEILVTLDGETIKQVKIVKGCAGNHAAIEALVKGRPAREVIEQLLGTPCRNATSCPDQLAKALQEALAVP